MRAYVRECVLGVCGQCESHASCGLDTMYMCLDVCMGMYACVYVCVCIVVDGAGWAGCGLTTDPAASASTLAQKGLLVLAGGASAWAHQGLLSLRSPHSDC